MRSTLIRSNICLLIIPISLFEGLMSLHCIRLGKLSLWSLMVIKAGFSANVSILSAKSNLSAMILALALISVVCDLSVFWYLAVVLFLIYI